MHGALEGHEQHFSVLPDGRCHCLLNGHVFPAEPQAVATFIRFTVFDALILPSYSIVRLFLSSLQQCLVLSCRGRKYGLLCAMEEDGKVLQSYEPYLTPSKNFE